MGNMYSSARIARSTFNNLSMGGSRRKVGLVFFQLDRAHSTSFHRRVSAPAESFGSDMAKMGRPKIAPGKRQSQMIALRVTPNESRKLEKAASKAGLSVSDYIRQKLELRGDK